MATGANWKRFKKWAKSHSLHQPGTKLPLRMAVELHEEAVDFIHGSIIGLLIGFLVGMILIKNFGL